MPVIIAHFNLLLIPSEGVRVSYYFERQLGKYKLYSEFDITTHHVNSANLDLMYSTYLFGLEYINLCNMKLSEQFFLSTSKHANLRDLTLYHCDFESNWLSYLSSCKKICHISIINRKKHGQLQHGIITMLDNFRELESLILGSVAITDSDVIILDKLNTIEVLHFCSCTFQNHETLEYFYKFIIDRADNVRCIYLENIPNINQYLQAILDKPTFDRIIVCDNAINDEVLDSIKMPIGQEKSIVIKCNAISDDGLMKIRIEPYISLELQDTNITEIVWNRFLQVNQSIENCFYRKDKIIIKHQH
jgi:hypothetical protein